jgi:hypothetical protein
MAYPRWSRLSALGAILSVSGCAVQHDGYAAIDGSAPDYVATSDESFTQPIDTEPIGEAKEELSKWVICYKTTHAAAKLACGRTHTPPDVCHHFADALATRACQRFL